MTRKKLAKTRAWKKDKAASFRSFANTIIKVGGLDALLDWIVGHLAVSVGRIEFIEKDLREIKRGKK